MWIWPLVSILRVCTVLTHIENYLTTLSCGILCVNEPTVNSRAAVVSLDLLSTPACSARDGLLPESAARERRHSWRLLLSLSIRLFSVRTYMYVRMSTRVCLAFIISYEYYNYMYVCTVYIICTGKHWTSMIYIIIIYTCFVWPFWFYNQIYICIYNILTTSITHTHINVHLHSL